MKTLTTMLLILISFGAIAQKDLNTVKSNSLLAIELDPAPFILGGYSISIKYSPEKLSHFTLMGSMYSSKFPDNMMSKENLDKGFRDLKINTSYALFADYFIKPDRSGLHFGPSVFYYSKSVGTTSSDQLSNFKSIYPNIRIGYVYKPFKKYGFYLNPWVNVGKELLLDSNNSIEGKEFKIPPISYILALHIGYQITF